MKISRRDFTISTAAGLMSLPLLTKLAHAQGPQLKINGANDDPHFFIFVQVFGAWDVCLALDPKDRDLLLPNKEKQFDQPYSMNDVKNFNGIKLAPDGFVLGKYADKMAIVNGIDMEVDNGHNPDNIMTGIQDARRLGSPYMQAVLAKRHPFLKRCSVPHIYMSYDGQFMAGPYASSSLSATAQDFVAFIDPGSGGGASDLDILQANLSNYRDVLSPSRRQIFNGYVNAVQSSQNVNAKLKSSGFKAPADIDKPQGVGNLLGQLFSSGVLGSATLSFGSKFSFDTHSDHYAKHPLKVALEEVDILCAELKKIKLNNNHSVFDRTTVVMTAEYARTPRLNSSQGKDHNFRTNSLLAIGHNVRPGVYGQSGVRNENGQFESHAAIPVDFATGKAEGGDKKIIKAKNLWAGFGGIAGVDLSNEFGSDTVPIKFLG